MLNVMMHLIQHYNHKKYWKMRSVVVNKNNRYPKFIKIIYLFRIKRMDAFNNASFGTHLNYGATFISPPRLPHHLNGIIVSHNAVIGENVTIFHQVTIGQSEKTEKAPKIGNNVLIGAGAKIIGDIEIGDNVKIGANAVVTKSVPAGKTVVEFNKIL